MRCTVPRLSARLDHQLDEALQASDLPEIEWDMATSWPIVLDTIYGSAGFFAEQPRSFRMDPSYRYCLLAAET